MQSLFKILISLIFATLCFSSCKKAPEPLSLPYRRDVPVLLATHIISFDLREIHFSLDLAVFQGDNEINEVKEFAGLPDSSFKIPDYITTTLDTNTWVRHTIEKAEYINTLSQNTFSTIFLIDQSQSPENFDSTDYYNQRFQAFNAFYKTLDRQGKVIFSSYNRSTSNRDEVLKVINKEFSDRWDAATAKSLLDLTHRQAGSSGLYDALEQAIIYISLISAENKSITLFIRNKDDGLSRLGLDEIVSLAKVNNVKINVIWLIHDTENVDSKTLRQLSTRTGGYTVYMSSIYQSTTVFLRLAQLLKMETNFYRVSVKLTIDEPNYFATKYSTGMYLYYYVSQFYKWSYVPLYLEKP
jgi:hypothetical protein